MREKQNVRILDLEGVPPAVGPYSHVAIVEPDRRQALISGQVAQTRRATWSGSEISLHSAGSFSRISVVS